MFALRNISFLSDKKPLIHFFALKMKTSSNAYELRSSSHSVPIDIEGEKNQLVKHRKLCYIDATCILYAQTNRATDLRENDFFC